MSKKYDAGVKEYRDTYWTPEYVPLDTDLLACFKCTGQEGVPREEVAAAVAAESSTGTWSTVWSELLTDLEFYKGRCYRIEDVPGDPEAFYAFIAYPLDLFEEGSITNVLTSLVGNVFGFKALRHLRLEDIRFPIAFIKTCGGPPNGIVVERDRLNKYGRSFLGCTIKPKLGLSAKNYGRAVYECLRGGLIYAGGIRKSSKRNERNALNPKTFPTIDVNKFVTDPSSKRSNGYATYAINILSSPGTASKSKQRPL